MSIIKKFVICALAFLIFASSILWAAKAATAPETYADTIQYLDDKKLNVLTLAGIATTVSVAITALPDDIGTPIADELADLSGYFLLIISTIILEKYSLTLTGFAAFYLLIPIACILLCIYALWGNTSIRRVAFKLAAFAAILVLLVPISVKASMMIEDIYGQSAAQIVENTKQDADKTDDNANESPNESNDDSDQTLWAKITTFFSEVAKKIKDGVTDGVSSVKEQAANMLNRFVDALAILIVTSCLMPILILLVFVWVIKLLFGINIDTSKLTRSSKSKANRYDEEDVSVGV